MIYFDDDTRFAVREFDLMKSGKLNHKGLVQLHEAYMVRKYLILIMDFVEGKTLLDQFKGRHSATEDDVAFRSSPARIRYVVRGHYYLPFVEWRISFLLR